MTSWSSEYKILRAQNEALKEISLAADTVKVFRIELRGRFGMGHTVWDFSKSWIPNQKIQKIPISGIYLTGNRIIGILYHSGLKI